MKLKLYGDKHLLTICSPIEKITQKHRDQAGKMHNIMRAERGVGLSAPQVGLSSQIIVVNTLGLAEGGRKLTMFNPKIVSKSETEKVQKEGCLSFPNLFFDVKRPEEVTVNYLDRDGIEREETFIGLTAQAVLHEIDHLQGILFTTKKQE
jgi:peptide deformylase